MNRSRLVETYSLSPMQRGMLFHTDYDHLAGFYVQQMVCTLREDLDVSALQKAWQQVIDRHPILRTSFRWDVDEPLQEVYEAFTIGFQKEDWRDKSEQEQTARLLEYLKSDRRRGFQPSEPPLMRLALFRLADSTYQMIWTFHHALLDGRSHHLVLKEVFGLYDTDRSGQNVALNEPRPYRDYIEWLGHRDGSRDEQFWRQRLEGFTSPAPLDFDGSPVNAHLGDDGLHEIRLDENTTAALQSLAKRHELTLNTLVQGTWALLLSHHGGTGDVVFGATRACRWSTLKGVEEMIGMFINTLPVRVRVAQGMPLIQWLKDLRQQNIEVRDYEHTPLFKIQSWSELPKGAPLFESILVFENYEFNDSLRALAGSWKNREFRLEEKSNYPIVVAAYAGAELLVKVQYDRNRFADPAIERVLRQFRSLLSAFLSAPAENLSCGDVMRYLVNSPDEKPTAQAVKQDDQETDVYIFPASFGQQRLWFLNQLEPASSFYNIPLVARIKGPLKPNVLRRAVNAIVERHEALRTTFATEDGQLQQLIAPEAGLALPLVDLTGMPDDERETFAQRLAKTEAEVPFDLARGPLLRVGLLKLRQDEYVLLVTMHHICSDGWSIKVFLNELAVLYQAFLDEKPSPLPELAVQYPDFAQWQRELLGGNFLEEQLAYWRKQLDGAPAVLELPADRPRPPVQTFRGERRTLELPEKLRNQLSEFSRHEGVTLFMTLLAAFQTLLYRYSGLDDIVVGSPSASRNRSEIEKLIGFFVNTLVLRTDLSGNPSFRQLLKSVRKVAVEAYTHQDVPFDKLVDELNPERSLSHSPLFQVIFALEKSSDFSPELAGLDISWLEVDRGTSKFDLALFVSERLAGLSCLVEYDADLFCDGTIARLLNHFQVLLEGIVKNPDCRVGELPLLTGPELVRLIGGPIVKTSSSREGACLHQSFELQVERTPESVAVAFENEELTYRELNERANQLAHHLRKKGVGPEVLVGFCLERSVEMIVSLLGILKAGGAYLPLDPAYPPDRLSFMLKDAEVKVLLTNEHLVERVPSHGAAVLLVDREWEMIAHESKENSETNCIAANLAYVIYTSGSTGKPKGVLVTHQNVARLFEITDSCFGFNKDDVWTLFHSSAFDFSVWEIWGALLYGGRLVVVPYWVSRAPEDFLEMLCREGVTVLNQTPSAFHQLVRAATASSGKETLALRLIIFGGEALELKSLEPWVDRYGDRSPRLINMYGITETTVHVTYRPLNAADLDENSGSVIGNPLSDLQVYLLDPLQQPVPIGVPGEMYVGGAGLSRGYLKRPDLTAERFVPDAFSNITGARLYRSGDLARHLANGDIEYLGRVDRQVKIRGFRIELGEIEAVLRQNQGLQECAVVAKSDSPGQTSLVAYVVLDSVLPPKIEELRRFAKEKLPDYMVPAFFVPLERIPLTPNGKIDSRALPLPEKSRSDSGDAFVEPRTETEKKFAAIWGELLGREQIGIYDNFFELGGHSLLATQVVSRVRDAFQIRLSLRSFFENPTVAALAEFVVGATKESPEAIVPIKRLQRDESPSLTPDSVRS
jgi:amino acid adenylation domain-containing protein